MDDADRLHEQGDLWGALERFQAADRLMHAPTTALELAKVQALILQLVEARATALGATRIPVQPGEASVFASARAEAAKLAAELAPRIPDLTLTIEPANATETVSIDGNALPQLPHKLPYKLNPGSHLVLVEAPGFVQNSQRVSLAERQHASLSVVLVPEPAGKVAALSGGQAVPGAAADPNAAGRTRGYIGLAAGGAVLIAGAVAGIVSLTSVSDVRDQCQHNVCPASARSRIDTADTLGTLANIALPLGALGIGYGLFELLTHAEVATERSKAVSVQVTPFGVSMRGAL
jgi:hypothetical protein